MSRRRPLITMQPDLPGIAASDRLAFTPQEVSRFLGVGLGVAYDIAEKIGARVGPKGGRWLVSREALLAHLKGCVS